MLHSKRQRTRHSSLAGHRIRIFGPVTRFPNARIFLASTRLDGRADASAPAVLTILSSGTGRRSGRSPSCNKVFGKIQFRGVVTKSGSIANSCSCGCSDANGNRSSGTSRPCGTRARRTFLWMRLVPSMERMFSSGSSSSRHSSNGTPSVIRRCRFT